MVLYTQEEILERIEGLISLMFEKPKSDDIQYQSYVFKIILQELFNNANERHEEKLKSFVIS
jgi:hypothetical protein